MITFIEDKHQYFSPGDQRPWTSVTQLIHKYQPQKDWDQIAKRYAKKHGIEEAEVKRRWKQENENSLKRGRSFHKQREEDLLSCQTIGDNGKALVIYQPTMDDEGNKISLTQKISDGIYPELLVALNSARVCGQADYVAICDGKINIKDYKTNKEIKKNGFVGWDGLEEMMLDPISGIPNSNYWHYALQLNIYAHIIKKNNPHLKIGTLEMLHILFDEQEEVKDIVRYTLPDLQIEVANLLDHHKTHKNGIAV